jgi:hypothetical protein
MKATLCLLLFVIGIGACAQVAAAQPVTGFPLSEVVSITTSEWRSFAAVTCDTTGGCEVALSPCRSNVGKVTLAPGESAIVSDLPGYQCGTPLPAAIFSLPILRGTPRITTLARFKSQTNVALIEVPALETTSLTPGGLTFLTGRLIQADADYDTTLALFNRNDQPQYVTITVRSGSNVTVAQAAVELMPGFNSVRIKASPATPEEIASRANVFHLPAPLASGRVEIRSGTSGFGCLSCTPTSGLAGVAFVNWLTGGSPRVVPLTVTQP